MLNRSYVSTPFKNEFTSGKLHIFMNIYYGVELLCFCGVPD